MIFKKINPKVLLFLIVLIAIVFRSIGFNWDQGQHLHPDERFLTMVSADIKLPSSFKDYLNPQKSTLNPYNTTSDFFVYGTLPLNITRFIGENINLVSYDNIHFVGRFLTILLDVLIVLFLFSISKKIFNQRVAFLASLFYSLSVLPIQLSHFYTVDSFLNFFIVLSFYFLISFLQSKNKLKNLLLLSLSFVCAMSSKISAIYFLPIISLAFLLSFYKKPKKLIFSFLIFTISSLIFLRLLQPYLFSSGNLLDWHINPQFVTSIQKLQTYNQNVYYPPGIQWLKTLPIVFPLKNLLLWGLGIPLALAFMSSFFHISFFLIKNKIKKNIPLFLILFWVLFIILFQGLQHVTTMRYFLIIYPFISLLSAFSFEKIYFEKLKLNRFKILNLFLLILIFIYPISFTSIYFKNHSRVTASEWIYENVPASSVIATEYWDDSLPLTLNSKFSSLYQFESLSVASQDNSQKINVLKKQLEKSDYIILSSNRFYLPISKNKDYFPFTSKYYQTLFNSSLGFEKIAEFSSYPCFPPGKKSLFCFNDDSSEEAFTVYDHPKVYIFKKTDKFNLSVLE